MPLKDKTKVKKEGEETEVSGALSTDEIVSLLSKSNKDFIKESEISSQITTLFKKLTPKTLAQNSQIENSVEKNSQAQISLDEKKMVTDDALNDKNDEVKPEPEKKYTEDEAKRMANEYAKKYYNNGYKLGVKKTTEDLQKGDKALAVSLKNTTDNLFDITSDFTKNLNNSITDLVSNLCKEVLGYEIDNNNQFFQDKIDQLVNSIEISVKDVKVYLNPDDFKSIENYNNENNIKLKINLLSDDKLERGDIKIKSGSIEIGEIVSNKIKFMKSENIEFDNPKTTSQNSSVKINQ